MKKNNDKKIIAIIPARGGSKRLPGKNAYPVWGRPMLCWAIDACKESKYSIDVCVSSDCEKILSIAKAEGAITHNRSEESAGDKTYKQAAIREAAAYLFDSGIEADIYISLQANSPTLTSDQLDRGIQKLIELDKDEIFSVDKDLLQNAAFRIFKGDYVFQKDLSTNCGVIIEEAHDVHTLEDIRLLEATLER